MRIVDLAYFPLGLGGPHDQLTIPSRRHRELIYLYARTMYTTQQAQLCPAGLLCLEGVNSFYVAAKDSASTTMAARRLQETIGPRGRRLASPTAGFGSAPFSCPAGSYCPAGSDSVIGTGLCPVGYYCPLETQYPLPARPGTFTGNFGAIEP
jgi:hypothetical protein